MIAISVVWCLQELL